ncbi:MAG TPA: hypothetical protein VI278_06835 [Nitrososphaeraceae archaeon]
MVGLYNLKKGDELPAALFILTNKYERTWLEPKKEDAAIST